MNNNIKRLTILFMQIVFVYYLYGQTVSRQDSILGLYATSMHNLGLKSLSNNQLQEALEYTKKAVDLRLELLGEKNKDYIISLHNLAVCYAGLCKYEDALNTELKVCNLIDVSGLHNDTINALASRLLGNHYYNMGNIEEAIKVGKEACKINKLIFGDKHFEYANSLNLLGNYYATKGLLTEAIKIENEALSIHSINKYDFGIATSHMHIGTIYSNQEQYSLAIKHLEKSANIYESYLDKGYYYMNIASLINCYNGIGNYSRAIIIGESILDDIKKLNGENNPVYSTIINNLAISYFWIGNSDKFIQYSNKVLELHEKMFGEKHFMYAISLMNTAFMYGTHINVKTALEMNQKAIDIFRSNGMTENANYNLAIGNQVMFNISLKRYKESIIDIQSILPQIDNHSSLYAYYLNKLSVCYNGIDDFDNAIRYNAEALELYKKLYGKDNVNYIIALEQQTENLLLGGSEEQFIKNLIEESESITLFTQNNVLTYSDKERQMWWNEIRKFYQDLGNYVFEIEHKSDVLNLLYNGTLLSKGILLNIDKGTKEAIKNLKDNAIEDMYNQLQLYRKKRNDKINNLYANERLQNDIALLEREILDNVKKHINIDNYYVTVDSIKTLLGPNDIAIEFFDYPHWQLERDSMVFAALMIKKDWPNARLIPLKGEKLMRQQYYTPIDSIPENALYNWIFGGMEYNKLIKPGDNIYFSASGILHQIPIESLPIGDGKIMSDVYNMHRLSSTRELVKEKKEMKYTKAALYGGLNYDMTDDELLSASQTYTKDASTEYFVSRGLLEDSIRGYKWDNLSNAQQEVDYISDLMKKNQITTQTYKGNIGNEESFKALSGHGYNIIHLATHGFFYPDEEAKEKDYFKPLLLNDHYQKYNEVDMSMWRSGLVLSGGNRAWKGDSIPDTVEDGILKAQEIGDLDLRGADLVVLSACNTGQGEVTGEGVFGLQRAFKMAGVQTIVMSLTPVDDQPTMAMMNKFYTNLFSGQSKHDAFYNAQRYIRSIKPDPKYWMGWIMLD